MPTIYTIYVKNGFPNNLVPGYVRNSERTGNETNSLIPMPAATAIAACR
jgi:hypothetical protein